MGEEYRMGLPPAIVGQRRIQLGIYGWVEFTPKAARDLEEVTGFSIDARLIEVLSTPDRCIRFRRFIENCWGVVIRDDRGLDCLVVKYRGPPEEQLTHSNCPNAACVDERCLAKDSFDDVEELALTNICGAAGKLGDEYCIDSGIF